MLPPSPQVALPRRVIALFLLFGLAAVVWLGVAAYLTSGSIARRRAESTCLNLLGRVGAAVSLEYARNNERGLEPLVELSRRENSLAYCAVVSSDGRFLAHSDRALTGRPCVEPQGAVASWGDVSRVRYVAPDSRVLYEYQSPLRSGDRALSSLRIAVLEPSIWGLLRSAGLYAPLALLGPLVLMGLGAVALRGLVQPLSEIDTQLRHAALASSMQEFNPQPVRLTGPASVGWNRIVNSRDAEGEGGLAARLAEVQQGHGRQRLDAILGSMPDGVAVTDGAGRIEIANEALRALLAVTEAPPGVTIEQLLAHDWKLDDGPALLDPAARGRPVTVELKRTAPESKRVLRVARHPLRDLDGRPQGGHVWSVRDVSQQKLADAMRTQFVDTATHELRTPLANIRAYAETLSLSDITDIEQQKEFVNTINTEAARLSRFVEDLLSVSSMEVGGLTLNRTVTDVGRMIQEVISKVKPQMDHKKIGFETSVQEKFPPISLDKDKIAAMLVNLLGNAVKYTPLGGRVALRVRTTRNALEIDVEDSGVGISEEEMPHIFDKFFRSKDRRVQAEPGTGLGLALAQDIVQLHGGTIGVKSKLNKGTAFQVELPLT